MRRVGQPQRRNHVTLRNAGAGVAVASGVIIWFSATGAAKVLPISVMRVGEARLQARRRQQPGHAPDLKSRPSQRAS